MRRTALTLVLMWASVLLSAGQGAAHAAPDRLQIARTGTDAVVIEDAVSGVAAGHAGHFGLVIGVDRGAGADALREHGADLVVDDLDELLDSTS